MQKSSDSTPVPSEFICISLSIGSRKRAWERSSGGTLWEYGNTAVEEEEEGPGRTSRKWEREEKEVWSQAQRLSHEFSTLAEVEGGGGFCCTTKGVL